MFYDLIIIGGGPTGITAGIYAARQKINTLLITKSFGGQMVKKTVGIENYPGFEEISGLDLIKRFENHLRKFTRQNFAKQDLGGQVDIEIDEVIKLKKNNQGFLVLTKNKHKFRARAVIVASGADPRPLKVLGEKKFIGKGVAYCVTCDGPLFANKTVAVVGGGNSGFEAAIFLANWVKKIYILEHSLKIRADEAVQEKAKKTGKVEIITSAALKKIEGKESKLSSSPTTPLGGVRKSESSFDFADAREGEESKLSSSPVAGAREGKDFVGSIVYQDNKTKKIISLKVDGVFVEIGSQPAVSFVKELVDFNEKDEIIIDLKTMQTKTPGLFAAGDVADVKYKQIVIAAGQGAQAALSVSIYLQKMANENQIKNKN